MIVEYAGIVAAISLLAATLTGAYGNNVAAVFASSGASVAAVTKAAKKEGLSPARAKAAYKRAPYRKPALKYLYALGWIGGTKRWPSGASPWRSTPISPAFSRWSRRPPDTCERHGTTGGYGRSGAAQVLT